MQNANSVTPATEAQFQNASGGRGHLDLGGQVYPHVFARELRDARGYQTAYFGKCMNSGCGEAADVPHGQSLRQNGAFMRWFEPIRLESVSSGSSSTTLEDAFFDSEAAGCVWHPDRGYDGECTLRIGEHTPGSGYSTSEIGNATASWVSSLAQAARTSGVRVPWMSVLAVEAPKLIPAPWHWSRRGGYPLSGPCVAAIAPRLPSWNHTGPRPPQEQCSHVIPTSSVDALPVMTASSSDEPFHELIACQPPLTVWEAGYVDRIAKRRCASMMAVDDSISGVLDAITTAGEGANTYVMMTSDHGFTLGHHGLPREKGFLYEHNLRVPMLISGPGIAAGVTSTLMGSHVDLAPTILALANIATPPLMDGQSLVPSIITNLAAAPPPVRAYVNAVGITHRAATLDHQLVMHYNQGPYVRTHASVTRYYDDWSNTFVGLVTRSARGMLKLGVYDPYGKQTAFSRPNAHELFNLTADPFETLNVYERIRAADPQLVAAMHLKVREMQACRGVACTAAATTALTAEAAPLPLPAMCAAQSGQLATQTGQQTECERCLARSSFCPTCVA